MLLQNDLLPVGWTEPYVGKNYRNGLNGKKVLCIGESNWGEDPWDKQLLKRWTSKYVNTYGERDGLGGRFWTNLGQALTGVPCAEMQGKAGEEKRRAFWNSIAIYNYFSHSSCYFGGALVNVPADAYDNGVASLKTVIADLKPDLILVFSKRIWEFLVTQELLVSEVESDFEVSGTPHRAIHMRIEGVPSIGLVHPSHMQGPLLFHKIIWQARPAKISP